MKTLKTAKWLSLALGIIAILAGILVLLDPVDATMANCFCSDCWRFAKGYSVF